MTEEPTNPTTPSGARRIEPFTRLITTGVVREDPASPNFADYVRKTVEPYEPGEEQLALRRHVMQGGYAAETIPVPEVEPEIETEGFFPEDDVPEV